MALDPNIWQDILTRMKNLRGDIVVQWQGDLDNRAVERAIVTLSTSIQMWEQANPSLPPE